MHRRRGPARVARPQPRHLAGAALLAAVALSGGASCKGGSGDCQSTRAFFEQQVWSAFMSTTCGKCHTPDGTAVADSNAKFVIQPSSYPGFIDANLANITMVANIQFQGTPEILLKPLGQDNHGGGVVLQAGSPEYQALQELVTRVTSTNGDACPEVPNTTLSDVTVADGPTTLRRAAIDLCGRLPTAAESTAVATGGDTTLDAAVDELMTEPAFYVRLREMFNDVLLTDEFLEYNGRAIDFTDTNVYPAMGPYRTQGTPQYTSPLLPLINQALAREPLDLIAYIVQNGKPFTDVVAGTYTVVNPFSAIAYGLDKTITFKDPTNYNEFYQAQVTATIPGQNGMASTTVAIPHAGVLSTPAFLNRWTTTPTNIDRGRARRIFQFFLATDVLKIATRPVDATTVTALEDPTRNSSLCNVCHKVIDPVAGGFRGYDDNTYEDYNPATPWHDNIYPPGFGATNMDASYYTKALQWLGPQVAADPRFPISAVQTVLQGMTGHTPLAYPPDSTDPNFATELAAWSAQDAFIRDTATAFTNGNSDLRLVFKAVIKSPYYRGISAPAGTDPGLLANVGAARLLTPEILNRKIAAVMGYRWRKPYDWMNPHDWLLEDYNILYGGIDSDSTITRLTVPNGIISSVANRFGNEAACAVTAWDFTKDKSSRTFFPQIDLTEVPESAGHTVDGSVADIKANIQYLHQYLLSETLDVTDPEIERTYQLFLDTWHELSQAGDTSLAYNCQGQWNPNDGTSLAKTVQITDDKNYTLRSWMAVMTYLLSDYKFLFE
jgi:hypothetical protein